MRGAQVRREVGHPVLDADGHLLEFMPAILPYVRETLSAPDFARYTSEIGITKSTMTGPGIEARRRSRLPQGGWWGSPVRNVVDLASSMAPRLFHERLPELGFDYAVLYPSYALGSAGIADDDLRIGVCRGVNDYFADVYGPYADRCTVAGLIPMQTPQEAIAELAHCKQIGLKVVGIHTGVLRPIEVPAPSPWLMPNQTHWWDHFGVDSLYDYDPVWRTFAELGFAVTVHWGIGGPPTSESNYTSVSNFMANHIASFAGPTAQTVKSLYLGGVTRRLPDVVFGFQECGVAWAASLLGDSIEHWEKRNLATLRSTFDPALLDVDRLASLLRQYAPELVGGCTDDELLAILPGCTLDGDPPEEKDDWRAMEISDKQDLVDLFANNFYFGCEADDRGVAAAFAPGNPRGARLKPMLGSDISHFDAPDFEKVLADAFGLVEQGVLTAEEFRRFTFENGAEMFLRANPDFFVGTQLESEVAGLVRPDARPS